MGNAQEAIQDYEKKIQRHGRIEIVQAANQDPSKIVTMILDHEYDEQGNVSYKAQREDGYQRWIKNPDGDTWKELIDDYWNNAP